MYSIGISISTAATLNLKNIPSSIDEKAAFLSEHIIPYQRPNFFPDLTKCLVYWTLNIIDEGRLVFWFKLSKVRKVRYKSIHICNEKTN